MGRLFAIFGMSLLWTFLLPLTGHAQKDTLSLDLREAERRFVLRNHLLLAQQFEIEQARAELITARLYANPELSYENQFYNQENGKFFQTNSTHGQFQAEISQLIRLAGKRNKHIRFAQGAIKISELEFQDLLRSLRMEFSTLYFQIYAKQSMEELYVSQVHRMEVFERAIRAQLLAGNAAQKELLRVQSQLYQLQAAQTQLQNELQELLTSFKVFTRIPPETPVRLTEVALQASSPVLFPKLLDSARVYRSDLQVVNAELQQAHRQLIIQKAQAVPDVELAFNYDYKGSHPEKYTGIALKIPLPLFNRNQGEIKKAHIEIEARKNQIDLKETQLQQEVFSAYRNWERLDQLYRKQNPSFAHDYEKLMDEMSKNYQNRNISLTEYMDFYDSYKELMLQHYSLQSDYACAKATLNYVTATPLFK